MTFGSCGFEDGGAGNDGVLLLHRLQNQNCPSHQKEPCLNLQKNVNSALNKLYLSDILIRVIKLRHVCSNTLRHL
jgi:hypothetical protein